MIADVDSTVLLIVSVKHTQRHHRYITFWRPANSGYCWPLSWAGTYTREAVEREGDYYNNGDCSFAVPLAAALAISRPPKAGDIDGNAGPVVWNRPENWDALRAANAALPFAQVPAL